MKHVTHYIVAKQTAPLPLGAFLQAVKRPDRKSAEYDRAAAQQSPCFCLYEIETHWGTDGYALLKPKGTLPLANILPPPVVFTGSEAANVRSQIDASGWERIDIDSEAITCGIVAGLGATVLGTALFYARFHLIAAALRSIGLNDEAGSTPEATDSLTKQIMARLVYDPTINVMLAATLGVFVGVGTYLNIKERLESARDDDYSLRDVLDIKDALDTRVEQHNNLGWRQWRDTQLAGLRTKVSFADHKPAAAQAARELIARIDATAL